MVQRVFIYLEIFLKNLFLSFLLHIASFSSKVGCEHEKVNFECEPYSRLVIYSASYGRTQYQSVQCPQPQGVAEESKFLLDILKKLKKWHLAWLYSISSIHLWNFLLQLIEYFGSMYNAILFLNLKNKSSKRFLA